ncbi:hypothetical protein K461DRAFT_219963 [Myriangium duriaei CBS 260.36]|uniref:Zn(2)-C6 fungal-type domain-containing protein n=1 Tax=Myriangium duriaei CBS 260.36 TaxID=1168546 RepID=A0A9P4MSK2_9PEZI|nr:hypothetical protein K461DRAFT_219963 [Myriangium duriaei CBS 260.36]
MPLETPLLKVSRPVAACSRCRAAKIKCDGKLPACSACEKTGKSAECASANDNFARGKERSYVSTLETRIEKLERRLHEAQQRKSSVVSMSEADLEHLRNSFNGNAPVATTETDQNATQERSQKAAKRKEARDIDELVSDFGYLTVNATARDYYGFTTFMSYARLILSACSKSRLPQGMSVSLPPRKTANFMIQHYLENIFTILPFFDETSLYYSIDSVYRAQDDPSVPVAEQDIYMVRMILAISNAFLSEQRGDQFYLEGVGHVSAALEYAERVLKPGAITTVQMLLFLAEYSLLDPYHFDSWSLIGAASRAMIDLGLHQDPPKGANTSKSKLELRRRVFHCVYILDRSAAIVQTRAFTFSDDSANVVSPFSNAPTPRTTSTAHRWLKTFDHSIDLMGLRRIQSKWYYDMFQTGHEVWAEPYPYIWQTYYSMTTWFANISKNTSEPMKLYYEMELLYSYIYVLGASPHVPRPHPYAQTLLFEHCISYASLLAKALSGSKHIAPVTFDDNMRAYMTGMQLLDVLVKSRDQLISGVAPEPPHLPPGSPSTPALPPLQNDSKSNVVRAINAIKSITDTLKAFGQRWGYSTWRDDFAIAVEPMLIALNSRLWELQQTTVDAGLGRRPSYAVSYSSGNISTLETLTRQSSNSHASPQTAASSPQQYQHAHHSSFSQPLTGPQIRAMRNSNPSMPPPLFNGMSSSNEPVSPPYEASYHGTTTTSSGSVSGSNANSPHQQYSHQHNY